MFDTRNCRPGWDRPLASQRASLARGALLMQLGRAAEAREEFNRAIALAHTPAEAAHIRRQLDLLAGSLP